MTQNIPRRHHYVPASYMSPWEGIDNKVCVYTKGYGGRVSAKRHSPGSIMFLDDLYADDTFDPATHEAQHLEHSYLQKLDDIGARLQRSMLAGRAPRSHAERENWTRFLLALLFRHPDDVQKLRDLHAVMWKQHEDMAIAQMRQEFAGLDPVLVAATYISGWRADQEARRVKSLRQMMDYGQAGWTYNQGHWTVVDFAQADGVFCLSDKPVFRSGTFKRPGDYIALPLGPKQLFVCAFDRGSRKTLPIEPTTTAMKRLNRAMAAQAVRYVVTDDTAGNDWIGTHLGTQPARSIADIMGEPFGL